MRTCSIKDCREKHWALGYCKNHYRKFRKYGDPMHCEIEMHGMYGTSEYIAFHQLKSRCCNKKHNQYSQYGGRGITVCDKWRDSFKAFFADMGKKPFPEAEIDRIDNDGDYEPGNCRWATSAQNCQNRSTTKLTMRKAEEIRRLYRSGGISQRGLGEAYGVDQSAISYIVNNKQWRFTEC